MTTGRFRFDRFSFDPGERQLRRDDAPVELNSRYLDALALLLREAGQLVSKDRFLDQVWRGAPVTDEALTQCIKTLRRQLGDSAASPRFIETVPKHGYRFIAPVTWDEDDAPAGGSAPVAAQAFDWRQFVLLSGAGTIGGGVAGLIGGLLYGFGGASRPLEHGTGGASVLLVLLCVNILVATIGAAGVSLGIAAAGSAPRRAGPWSIIGGALGGLIVGAVVKLLGLDAFDLLFGQSPGDITGAAEGFLLGGAVGLGAWLGGHGAEPALGRSVVTAGLCGGGGGILIALLGGRLMGGSLDLLARQFPGSRLRLDQIGGLFGESGFGPISQIVTGGVEGVLFGGCIVGAMILARRGLNASG